MNVSNLRLILPLAAVTPLAACTATPSVDTMTRIKPSMTSAQVEAILGRPARIVQSETTGLTGEVDYYPAASGEGRVVYVNNTVFKAEFIPGAKS